MNDTITAFARIADQARNRIEEISATELSRAKPLPVIIDVRESGQLFWLTCGPVSKGHLGLFELGKIIPGCTRIQE